MWMKSSEKQKCLPTTKRWQLLQASRTDRDKATGTIEYAIEFLLQDIHSDWPNVKWNDIPVVNCVKRDSLAWRVSKIVTSVAKSRLQQQEDGAVDWSSLMTKLRLDFEKEAVGDFSHSQWLVLKHRGDKKSFECCLDSNGNRTSPRWKTAL